MRWQQSWRRRSALAQAIYLQCKVLFDAETSVAATSIATVRTFVPPFAIPKANDIEHWANSIDSRAKLAALLRILVHSSCDGLQKVVFPAHDDSQQPGWDGEIQTTVGNPWVPGGSSGWEFGVNKDIKSKADRDFAKCVKAISKAERSEMTFVFVTPRRWPGKNTWRESHTTQMRWKDVWVWDSSDLEQWDGAVHPRPSMVRQRNGAGTPRNAVS